MRLFSALVALMLGVSIAVIGGWLLGSSVGWFRNPVAVVSGEGGSADVQTASPENYATELRQVLTETVKSNPTSATAWLLLAETECSQPARFNTLFGMAYTMGPRELDVVLERGVAGISCWQSLNDDMRSRVMDDIVVELPGWGWHVAWYQRLQQAIASQTPRFREQITSALAVRKVSPLNLRRLGLKPSQE